MMCQWEAEAHAGRLRVLRKLFVWKAVNRRVAGMLGGRWMDGFRSMAWFSDTQPCRSGEDSQPRPGRSLMTLDNDCDAQLSALPDQQSPAERSFKKSSPSGKSFCP